MMIAINLARI